MLLGMTSVTLHESSIDDIVHLAKNNNLQAIEWDESHVKRGQIAEAEAVRKKSAQAALRITAYSTDFNIHSDSEWFFSKVLETAAALGTDTITLTIEKPSLPEDTGGVSAPLIAKVQNLADLAASAKMKLCFAYRRGSLLEDYIHTGRFIEAISRQNVYISWQPNRTSSLIYNIFELKTLAPFVHHVYVSYPDADSGYTPIIEGKDEWHQYLKVLHGKPNGTLLFKDCNIAGFSSECALMQEWVAESE